MKIHLAALFSHFGARNRTELATNSGVLPSLSLEKSTLGRHTELVIKPFMQNVWIERLSDHRKRARNSSKVAVPGCYDRWNMRPIAEAMAMASLIPRI